MSDLTSKEKADRLRQLADLVDDMPHAVAWEVQRALREHADLVERPSEATEIHRIALDGLNGNDVHAYAALTKIAMATDPSLSAPDEPGEPRGPTSVYLDHLVNRCHPLEGCDCAACENRRAALTKGETP